MKRKLLRTLLVAATLLVGANAWGQDYPYNVGTSTSATYLSAYSPEYSLTGDGTITISFTNYCETSNANWLNWHLICGKTTDSPTDGDVNTNRIFVMRADRWENIAGNANGFYVSSDYFTDFMTFQNEAIVTMKIIREGTKISVLVWVTKGNETRTMSYVKTGVEEETVKFYLTGSSSYLVIASAPTIDTAEYTWQQTWTESTAATGWAAYGASVSFSTPETSISYNGSGSRSARFSLSDATSMIESTDKWKLTMELALGNKGNYINAQDLNIYSSTTTLGTKANTSGWNYEISNPATCFLNLVNTTTTNEYSVSIGSTNVGNISPTAGTYYTYTIEYDPTTKTATISIGNLLSATVIIPSSDGIGNLTGIHFLAGRGAATSKSKGVTLYKQVDATNTMAPTYTILRPNGTSRIITLDSSTENATLKWSETEPEGADYSGWTEYDGVSLSTSAATIYAVAYANGKYSDVTTISTGAGTTVPVNGASFSLPYYDASEGGYYVKVNESQTGVLGTPTVSLAYYTSDPESTTACTAEEFISGFAPSSSVYVVASANGYESTTTSYTFPALVANNMKAVWSDVFTGGGSLTTVSGVTMGNVTCDPVTKKGDVDLSGNVGLYAYNTTRWSSTEDGLKANGSYYLGAQNVNTSGLLEVVVREEDYINSRISGRSNSSQNYVVKNNDGTYSMFFTLYNSHTCFNNSNTVIKKVSFLMPSVTLTSSANLQGYKTFYNANKAFQVDDNTTIYTAATPNGTTVTITPVDGKIIPANTPVILKTTNSDDYKIVLTETTGGNTDDFAGNVLQAADTYTNEADAGTYILAYTTLNGLGFYPYSGSLDAGDVYLTYANGGAHIRIVFDDDTVTGISNVKDADSENGAMFNLSGQRVNNTYKGIVIMNGKKYLVK